MESVSVLPNAEQGSFEAACKAARLTGGLAPDPNEQGGSAYPQRPRDSDGAETILWRLRQQ